MRLLLVLFALASCYGASPTYFGAGAIAAAVGTTDVTPALPASTATNDIIIVHCYVRNTAGDQLITDYEAFGLVETANAEHRWFWKRHDGTEGNPTCDRSVSGDIYARVYVFRGCITTGDPFHIANVEQQHSSEPMTVTGITTSVTDTLIVVMDGYADDNASSATTTATNPSTYTDIYTESTTGADGSLHMAYAAKTGTGATGDFTVDYDASFTGGDQSGSIAFALFSPTSVASQTDMIQPGIITFPR